MRFIEPGKIPGVLRPARAHDQRVVTERMAAHSGRSWCDRVLFRRHVAGWWASACGERRLDARSVHSRFASRGVPVMANTPIKVTPLPHLAHHGLGKTS